MLAEELADCSDDEEFCNDKIYVVIKGLSEEADDVYEFNSWEEAENDFDERYTSCCDDTFIAENVLFPILSYLREKEADKLMNFCSVIEFDATGLEENRENWEEKWEAGEI
jgi:hypothetical protein